MTQIQAEIIINLAKYDMNISRTARSMYMHRNSVAYHIKMIQQKTGLNPLNFYDLYALVDQAREVISNG